MLKNLYVLFLPGLDAVGAHKNVATNENPMTNGD